MISGPSDEEAVGAGADGASLDVAGTSVGEGSTFVTEYAGPEEASSLEMGDDEAMGVVDEGVGVGSALDVGAEVTSTLEEATDDVA